MTMTLPPSGSTCKQCGTVVPEGDKFCDVCKDKQGSRSKPMFDTGNHPAPPESTNDALGGLALR